MISCYNLEGNMSKNSSPLKPTKAKTTPPTPPEIAVRAWWARLLTGLLALVNLLAVLLAILVGYMIMPRTIYGGISLSMVYFVMAFFVVNIVVGLASLVPLVKATTPIYTRTKSMNSWDKFLIGVASTISTLTLAFLGLFWLVVTN